MQIFLFNNLSSASGKRPIFVTCYYFLLSIRYIARLMDVKTYNVFHQKFPRLTGFELFFSSITYPALFFILKGYLLVMLFIPYPAGWS
ncbi:hypothetical protein MM_0942 [Methanosarcina mazei Go1]|uniref:Uncharacterized protein n=1 Tax=Methanosarcina mazei (strain ATCC BAA-159 / DSM 3647 / Goe1 / Go1 / JCM 11833 / OCM 88) TaxID=192952 RepID=Q8PYC1_METMA|nr:hypothetical protein MM_0942 [Methanosarcina mazei Go1]